MVEWIYKLTDISSIKRISFRQDINGLRAIAVLAVVFYHTDLELFKGGWLGVDIFFVISGYLISNIIISELNDGTFSFKTFYLRRVRRILPALFSTLLLTIPFAYFFLTPKAMEEYIDSLIASIFFFANYHFMNLDFYVAESTKLMPLMHTWSLAIEEQYYLLFPLLAFLVYKYFKKYFTFFIGFITVGSLYLNTLSQSLDKFYRLEFRIWELLLGVLIMILSSNLKIKHLEKIGLPLMLFPIFYFGDSWINHAEPKLIALLGVSLIIFSNTNSSMLTKVLSFKLISIIGLSSYSLYLFHQPIFAFFRIYYTQINWKVFEDSYLSNYEVFTALILTFTVSVINYKIVEIYFLKKPNYKYILLLLFFIILNAVFLNTFKSSDIKYNNKVLDYTTNLWSYTASKDGYLCNEISDISQICSFNTSKNKKIILLGDSHARTLGYLLSLKLKEYNFEILSGGSCLFLVNYEYNENCNLSKYDKNNKNYILNQENVIFIYVGDIWDPAYSKYELNLSIPLTLNKLIEKNNKILVIEQIPNFPFNPIDKLMNNRYIKDTSNTNFIGIEQEYWINEKLTNPQLQSYRNLENSDIYTISPESYICNSIINNYCVAAIDDLLFYRDDNHLTVDGVNLFIDDVLNIIENISSK